jgi:LPXTG-motif cell wall-anchored protein
VDGKKLGEETTEDFSFLGFSVLLGVPFFFFLKKKKKRGS